MIAEQISPAPGGMVLELGAGTGAVTQAIRERGIADSELIAIESDPHFAARLREQYPRVRIVEGDAFAFPEVLRHDARDLRSIVCGVPVLGRPVATRRQLLLAAMAALKPGCPFIQFSYGVRPPIPCTEGVEVRRAATVWRNLPPMHIWVYRLSRAASPSTKFLKVTE